MELDHDTGEMHGRVFKGMFAGRDLADLGPAEIGAALAGLPPHRPQSAQLLEAYLDRVHPTWREDMARGIRHEPRPDGRMTEEEAWRSSA